MIKKGAFYENLFTVGRYSVYLALENADDEESSIKVVDLSSDSITYVQSSNVREISESSIEPELLKVAERYYTDIHIEKTYTRQEVANLLRIKEKTVYTYAQEGKIKASPNPYNVRRETVYTKESVDQLLAKMNLQDEIDGHTLQEASKELGLSRQRITSLIKEHSIPVEKNSKVRGGVPKTIIPKESYKHLKNIVLSLREKSNRQSKANFYSSELDIAYYQLFKDEQNNSYRVCKENGVWGYRTIEETFIPFEVAKQMNMNLKPAYSIHQDESKQFGYANFHLPMNNQGYIYYDFLLSNFGIENIYLDLEQLDNIISVNVRQHILPVDLTKLQNSITFTELRSFLVSGELILTESELFVIGNQRRISAVISLENYNNLLSLSEKEERSMSDVLDQILQSYFD